MLKPSPLFETIHAEMCQARKLYWDHTSADIADLLKRDATLIEETRGRYGDLHHVYVNKNDLLLAVHTRHTRGDNVMGTITDDWSIYDLKAWQSITAHTEEDLVLTVDQGVHEKNISRQNLSLRDGLALQKQFVTLCASLPDRWKRAYAFTS